MTCPTCNTELKMTDRQGVEIDYCPQCRGVWLDRGELDKIIERSAQFDAPAPRADFYEREREDEHEDRQRPYRKKRGFLGEMFDFD